MTKTNSKLKQLETASINTRKAVEKLHDRFLKHREERNANPDEMRDAANEMLSLACELDSFAATLTDAANRKDPPRPAKTPFFVKEDFLCSPQQF